MKTVQKDNRQLRVADDRLEDMLKSSYAEVDEKTGKLLRVPTKKDDAAALKKENAALKKENRELRAKLDALISGGQVLAPA